MAAEIPTSTVKLSSDELDDLIYFARAGDIQELHANIRTISEARGLSKGDVINAAVDIDPEDPESSSGCTLLHWAAANNHEDILNFLLVRIGAFSGSSVEPATVIGTAASAEISSASGPRPFKPRQGGLVNHQNNSGNTPLHWAALNGNLECVKFLVRAGADPSIRNAAGHDAVFEGERGELNKNGPPQEILEQEGQDEQAQVATKPVGVVEWLLENCEGLDRGVGGDGVEEAAAATPSKGDEMEVDG